ncbi:MAG TPA: EthD family reductase [Solirubrobacteraceae bacterium]|nr:EthD family reductase [Solirubrobacteraceae bacterium]
MYKLYAIWTHPQDVEAFERHYVDVHAPLAAAIPGLKRLVLTRTSDGLHGEASPFHRVAELWFESATVLERALDSPEMKAGIRDAEEMQERFGVQLLSPAGMFSEQPLGPVASAAQGAVNPATPA